jgi:hypothetical protein
MQVITRKTIDLIPYVNNARTHGDAQITQIISSIKEFGFTNPVLTDGENGIIAGHGRIMAAKKMGLEEVPTIELSHLSPAQKKAYILADNRLAELSGWDTELLKIEFEGLNDMGFDTELLGFEDFEGLVQEGEETSEQDLADYYTKKVTSPIYEPTGEKPPISELFDVLKTYKLIKEIEASSLPDDEKEFLKLAAYRHTVFDYQNIAEYYAHSQQDTQMLMENSALIIIDFEKAIEQGFVVLSEEIADAYFDDYEG